MRVLLVFDPFRKDLFSYLSHDEESEYFLIFHESFNRDIPEISFIKNQFFWDDFSSPLKLLAEIKPDRIVFQEVLDLKQISLCIAANSLNIPTIFLDHGIWSSFEEISKEDKKNQNSVRFKKFRRIAKINKVIKGYLFYYSILRAIAISDLFKFLSLPLYSFFTSSVQAIHKIYFSLRVPKKYILFAVYNKEPLENYYHFHDSQAIHVGFPQFDSYFLDDNLSNSEDIIFIDHPYLEDGFLNWDKNFHRKVAESIFDLAVKSSNKVIVKLHPRSKIENWLEYNFDSNYITYVQDAQVSEFYLRSKLIIGYASTLMIGFLSARKNVVLLGWHPTPGIFGPDFSKYGVCHKSLNPDEVNTLFDFWIKNNLSLTDSTSYNKFINLFNCPFDGKAALRVIEEINNV